MKRSISLQRPACLTLLAALGLSLSVLGAQAAEPVALRLRQAPGPQALPEPQAKAYPGTLTLSVDATDLDHRVLEVRETLPVTPGRLTLLYPRWLPGNHGPTGNVGQLAGLTMRAGSSTLPWQRDPVDTHAFHVDVPKGVHELTLSFQNISPFRPSDGRVTMTPRIVGLQWNTVVLYPAGHEAAAIFMAASVKLPPKWQAATALRGEGNVLATADADGWWRYAPTSLETLVDSPLFAGAHARRIELEDPGASRPVALNLVADEASQLEATPAEIDAHRALVVQAERLFGSRHWRHYDFLLAQSKEFSGIGLEHQESSENAVDPDYFKDWDKSGGPRSLLPHEFTHSWNGKYRRPDDLWTPNYNTPMRDSLLWVYEGQTQYWGEVLAGRSGLLNAAQVRHDLAQDAAYMEARAGRVWRNLQDTTFEPIIDATKRGHAYTAWQRGRDYYTEAALVWLDADSLIREKSGGQRSLDDFARAFFSPPHAGAADGAVQPRTYNFNDVVQALNAVQPHDWAAFLRQRLDSTAPPAPLDGLVRSGWRLVYTEKESDLAKAENRAGDAWQDLTFSLGIVVAKDGKLRAVHWDSPAFRAGLAPDQTLVAVCMESYTPDRLAQAITANKDGKAPVSLLVRTGERFRMVTLDYRGGLRYASLERIENTPDRLTEIFTKPL